jgi:hypothetical protein
MIAILTVAASGLAAPSVLVKAVTGPVTSDRLDLMISSVAPCDATKDQIPDNSRLVSDAFALRVDDNGVGWFAGAVRILDPDAKTIITGVLHGVVGLSGPDATDCKAPGHLQGMLNLPPQAADGTDITAARPVELFLSADIIPEAAGPVPVYRGRLSGLIAFSTPPPTPAVSITSARAEYLTTEPVTAVIANKSAGSVRAWDGESYCTIVRLEEQTSAGWFEVARCPLLRPTVPVTIAAGETKTVLLPPSGADANRAPGVYRVSLQYVALDASGNPVGESVIVSSDPFKVTAPAPAGGVTVAAAKSIYAPDEAITGVVSNGSAAAVVGYAFYSYCTILQLQMKSVDGWKPVGQCMLTGGPSVVIKPGESRPVLLPPDATTPASKDPGVYRLAFTFTTVDASGSTTSSATVTSPEFLVGRPFTASLRLAPDKPAYAVTDAITAILANGPATARIFDEQSLCTIVQLYRQDGAQWVLVGPCPLDRIPLPVFLKPGEVRKVTLAMNSAWPAGLYRMAVTFAPLGADGSAGPDQTVTTAAFAVGSTTPPSGKVILAPTQLVYGQNGRITGVIKNDTVDPILVQDERSYCTILTLEKKAGDAWNMVAGCPLARMPITTTIAAGAKIAVPLPPLTTSVVKNEPGVYRLVLDYTTPPKGGVIGDAVQVISPEFAVTAPTGTVRPVIF